MKYRKNSKVTKRKIEFLSFPLFLLCFLISCLLVTTSKDYKLEMLCNDFTLPRTQTKSSYKPSMFKFKYFDNNDSEFDFYYPLFYTYVYNSTVQRDAIISDEDVLFVPSNNELNIEAFNSFVVSQFLYTEVETKDSLPGKHILRHGRYACYLPIAINSYGADEFAFISDTIADAWIEKIGYRTLDISDVDTKTAQYSKLIKYISSNNMFFEYQQNGSAKFSITNVYYSDYGYAPRLKEIYGEFILSHALCHKSNKYTIDFHYELETQMDTFGNEQILKLVDGYYGAKMKVMFYTPSRGSFPFEYNLNLTNRYVEIRNMNDFSLGYCFALALIIVYVAIISIFSHKSNKRVSKFTPFLFFALLYGVFSTYLYFYSGFGVLFIIYLISTFVFLGKEGIYGKDKSTIDVQTKPDSTFYYEINL